MSDFVDNFPSHESILSDEFLEQFKDKQPNWGYNGLGYIVYKRTYARPIDPKDPTSRTEEWWETVARCVRGAQKIGACYTKDEAERLFNYVFHLKGNFAGRMLWQLGTSTVDRFGGNSLLNCWYVSITKPEDFCFIFENLMLGGGVGYSVKREHVYQLPKIKRHVKITHQKTNDADFIVPDSREGWVNLLRKVLKAYFSTGESFTYSTLLIRSKDEPIHGFGGKARVPKSSSTVLRRSVSYSIRAIASSFVPLMFWIFVTSSAVLWWQGMLDDQLKLLSATLTISYICVLRDGT
jgi:ribonucleoside-triphosphate reductase